MDFGPPPASEVEEFTILGVMDCPICHNRGTVIRRDEHGYLVGSQCECMAKRRSILRLRRSGLQDMIGRYTFEAFQELEPWQTKAKEIARQYAAERKGWFLAAGSVGAGKTHLCTAICAELIAAGIDTRYMLWRDEATRAKAVVGKDEEAYTAIVTPLKEVQALYIDDLFKTGREKDRFGNMQSMTPSPGDLNLAFEILNSRYNDSSKLTIISTELGIEDLMEIDTAIGSRIYERSKGHRLLLRDKPNWRIGDHDEETI